MELTPEEESFRQERLKQKAHEAAIMREFVKHPGFKILEQMVNSEIQDHKNRWLDAKSQQEAEEIRIKTRPWKEVYDLIFKRIANGDSAALQLRREDSGI